jgi:hypothetical protein
MDRDDPSYLGAAKSVPVGTTLLVRMIDTIDSSKNPAGTRFSASLETNLEVGGAVVAPAGTRMAG